MRCAWEEYLRILPPKLRAAVDRLGRSTLQELRLRIGQRPQLILREGSTCLNCETVMDDLLFVINAASQYSPWAAQTMASGYLTASGGHRIGVCGESVVHNGRMTTIRNPSALCIRVARDFEGLIGDHKYLNGSILILGAPGWGKTTLLRDLIRFRSQNAEGSIAVVDERGELFPSVLGRPCFSTGEKTDVLVGCKKPEGIEMLLRTMGPTSIAVDEITSGEDCCAMLNAFGCGVSLLATAHASSVSDLHSRSIYRTLLEAKAFQRVLLLHKDKSWKEVALSA